MRKVFPSDGSCVNEYVLFRASFLLSFFYSSVKQRRTLMAFGFFALFILASLFH